MRRLINLTLSFCALFYLASCSTALIDGMSARGVVHVKAPEDCREVTGKGETNAAWFLMSKDATIYVDHSSYSAVRVGQTVCGAWKEKEPAAQQQKNIQHHECPPDLGWHDSQCNEPNKT